MVYGVVMDVLDYACKIAVAGNFFSLKGADKERASSFVNFIIRFGVGVEQVAELECKLADEGEIQKVYQKIVYFSMLRDNLLSKLKKMSMGEYIENTADHLLVINTFEQRFFEKFWSYFKDIITIAEKKPEFLVKLFRLIDEDVDYRSSIQELFKQQPAGAKMRESRKNLRQESSMRASVFMSMEIQLKDVMEELIDSEFDEKYGKVSNFSECLETTLYFAGNLTKVKKFVCPCAPPYLEILEIYKAKYQENFEKHIKPFLNEDELAKEPGKLVHLARFLDEFQMVLAEVGINKDELQIYQVVS